jgi:hypothetical protein
MNMLIVIAIAMALIAIFYFLYNRKQQTNNPGLPDKIRKIQLLPVQSWDDAFLESKRTMCDPLADRVIQQIIDTHELDALNTMMGAMMRNDEIDTKGMPDVAVKYFEDTQELPSWADLELINIGEDVYLRHGGSIAFLLMYKSLPECYACAKGAEVLYRTGRLNEQNGSLNVFSRRIAETAQFLVNAMAPGGISRNGKGIRTAQKIRLIHAGIRFYLRQQNWDAATLGEPINQEDKTGTLLSFSALILEGLEMIGVQLTPTEQEAYMHCWRVIGYTMGVDANMLPNNVADGKALGHAIITNQLAASEGGRVLTDALLKFTHDLAPLSVLSEASNHMMRYLITDPIADLLGVPPAPEKVEEKISETTKKLMKDITGFEDHSLVYQLLARVFTKAILDGLLIFMNQEKRIQFYVPPALKKSWTT